MKFLLSPNASKWLGLLFGASGWRGVLWVGLEWEKWSLLETLCFSLQAKKKLTSLTEDRKQVWIYFKVPWIHFVCLRWFLTFYLFERTCFTFSKHRTSRSPWKQRRLIFQPSMCSVFGRCSNIQGVIFRFHVRFRKYTPQLVHISTMMKLLYLYTSRHVLFCFCSLILISRTDNPSIVT